MLGALPRAAGSASRQRERGGRGLAWAAFPVSGGPGPRAVGVLRGAAADPGVGAGQAAGGKFCTKQGRHQREVNSRTLPLSFSQGSCLTLKVLRRRKHLPSRLRGGSGPLPGEERG